MKENNHQINSPKNKVSLIQSVKLFFLRMINEVEANFRKWIRSPTTMFFALLYPVIFILLLGAIFSGIEEPFSFNLYVQNQDEGISFGESTLNFWNDTLQPTIASINNSKGTPLISILDVPLKNANGEGIDAGKYLEQQKGYICLIIPAEFTSRVYTHIPVNLTIIRVETVQSAGIVTEILLNIVYEMNLGFNNETSKVRVESVNFLIGEEISYVEYLIPGMIAITFTINSLMNTITRFNYNRTTGIFKKLSSSPMRKIDYVTSETVWQFLLAILALFASILTGWLAFGVPWSILHWMAFPIMLAGVMTFTGLGMIGARLVKTPNAAGAIGNIITYPMIFLSGAFFDISQIPVLFYISKVIPLTYLVDALRAAMITNNMSLAWMNLGISFGLAVVFMAIGILLTKWTDD